MKRTLRFSPEARADLLSIHDYIAGQAGEIVADRYISRVEAYLAGFTTFPERGTTRYDIRPGLRTVGFERRITIAFHIRPDMVVINRILYGSRSWDELSKDQGRD